uniref:C2H2-type domain-containing protein n=1 Tax=Mastacembelus armatus TaxID=205130 RepID=A0A3Q3NFG7_9TELE
LSSSPVDHSKRRVTQSDSCASNEKSLRTPKIEPQKKGQLRSNGKQGTYIQQIKYVRPLKPPPPRSSHPSQSIQKWHSCKECGKGFSFACQLEVHMRWHTKEKPYSCAVCRKSFTTVSMLKRHHRIHTGEKPFRCHVCGKCFNQSAHLNTHFRLHTRERANCCSCLYCAHHLANVKNLQTSVCFACSYIYLLPYSLHRFIGHLLLLRSFTFGECASGCSHWAALWPFVGLLVCQSNLATSQCNSLSWFGSVM